MPYTFESACDTCPVWITLSSSFLCAEVMSMRIFEPLRMCSLRSRVEPGIESIVPVKVALTAEQVEELNLPPNLTAKKTSSRRKGFVERFGENVFELEAIPPRVLQQSLRDAIDAVLDLDAYNAEIDREKQDAAFLDTVRRQAHAVLGDLGAS